MKPRHEWWVCFYIILVIAVPVAFTSTRVKEERPRVAVEGNETFPSMHYVVAGKASPRPLEGGSASEPLKDPSPGGYTWSLSMWLVPMMVMLVGLMRNLKGNFEPLKALFWVSLLLGLLGLLLDMIFGNLFFTFPNREAIAGPCLPALTWGGAGYENQWWSADLIPWEEYGFYYFGSVTIVMIYVWGNEYWFAAYRSAGNRCEKKEFLAFFRWGRFHLTPIIAGVLLFSFGCFWRYGVMGREDGFPGYLLFLVLIGVVPSVFLYHLVERHINFRALSATFVMTLLVSVFYEVVLGMPYQWWGYRDEQMMGLPINGFSGVPLEQPLLWVAIAWAGVVFYETALTLRAWGWGNIREMMREHFRVQ